MKSSVAKRSVVITGHKTSITLEDEFWKGLREIAHERDMTPSELIAAIDADRQSANLSSAIRLLRTAATTTSGARIRRPALLTWQPHTLKRGSR
jgi:predicted DNA-binding ribbon-helix-helix protein